MKRITNLTINMNNLITEKIIHLQKHLIQLQKKLIQLQKNVTQLQKK